LLKKNEAVFQEEGRYKLRSDSIATGAANDHEGKRGKKRTLDESASNSIDSACLASSKISANSKLGFDIRYILAPMVGASELPFRLLCRKYGATVAYTPMISSQKFATDAEYRKKEFQTVPWDRPLVCHFSANDPKEFAQAAKYVEGQCDAVDLNLGCPQRTAYLGHFGSYLLEPKDRQLICDIVKIARKTVKIPIFVKVRLLDTLEETITLCQNLRDAGASLIAVHARYRATWSRNGPGARDGPAMLDQVMELKKVITDIPIISNGNIITYEDVCKNLNTTNADGVMSAEGILDNPALFLPRYGPNDDAALHQKINLNSARICSTPDKKIRKIEKKLRQIEDIERKVAQGDNSVSKEQVEKMSKKKELVETLKLIQSAEESKVLQKDKSAFIDERKAVSLKDLYASSTKLNLANEYIALTKKYPTTLRTIMFHTRRMLKDELIKYQLMESCLTAKSLDEVEKILFRLRQYEEDIQLFKFDHEKAIREKETLEKKKREEGKRKAYEARMLRKAKREGKDSDYYLRQGADVPTVQFITRLKSKPKTEQLILWKKSHSQHCLSYHLEPNGCSRDRKCAFLHLDAKGATTFEEEDECCG